jgi:electron transfer flavoprotein alpha/beta subunit
VVAGRARGQASTAAYRHALAAGFDRAFLVAAAIAVLTLVVAITTIRLRRADLSDASSGDSLSSPAGAS